MGTEFCDPAVEILVLWGGNPIHLMRLEQGRGFAIGEEPSCDYFVAAQSLGGGMRVPMVMRRGGDVSLVLSPRWSGTVDLPGQGRLSLGGAAAAEMARGSDAASGAHELELPVGARARVRLADGELVFLVSVSERREMLARGGWSTLDARTLGYTGLSLLAHFSVVAVFAFFMPALGADEAGDISRDNLLTMQKLLDAAATREDEERTDAAATVAPVVRPSGGSGARAAGAEGMMGNPAARATQGRYAVKGPRDNPDPHLAKDALVREAAQFGAIGLLRSMTAGDPDAPTAAWGRDSALGADDSSARGHLFDGDIGDAIGNGGLGISGRDEGGGGVLENTIGMGFNFGPLGHGMGEGPGQGVCEGGAAHCTGHGRDHLGRGHVATGPRIRPDGNVQVNGRLPPEVIQRIVRQNFGRFRFCYEKGLRDNPNLTGRIGVKFAIGRGGEVAMAADGGSDIGAPTVVQCVVSAFNTLSFPPPEGGMVTVVYPIVFNPGD